MKIITAKIVQELKKNYGWVMQVGIMITIKKLNKK